MEELWESLHPSPPVVFFNHAFQIFGLRWTIKLAALKLQADGVDALRTHVRWAHAHMYTCRRFEAAHIHLLCLRVLVYVTRALRWATLIICPREES